MGGGPCFWIAVCIDLCVVQCLGAGLFLIGVLLVGMGLVSGGWSRLWIDVGGGPFWTAWWLSGDLVFWMVAKVP